MPNFTLTQVSSGPKVTGKSILDGFVKTVGVSDKTLKKSIQLENWAIVREKVQQLRNALLQRKSPAQLYQEMRQEHQQRDQLQALLKAIQDNYQLQNQLYNANLEKAVPDLVEDLRSDDPLTRFLAVQAVGQRRLHLERTLIDLLGDPILEVRQASRAALARLSRGTDFGPYPAATGLQVARAQSAWAEWLYLQDPPAQRDEPMSPTPQRKQSLQTQTP
jgi:hypothetical protein